MRRMYKFNYFLFIISALLISSCENGNNSSVLNETEHSLFTTLSSQETNIDFINTITNTEELNIFNYRNFYNGGGVGIGDINNDGYADVVFTANQGDNKLYLNLKDFTFKDITQSSGMFGKNKWSTGVVLVDVNADGWLDIYICNAGTVSGDNQKNELYINNKDLTFTEVADGFNLDDNGFTTHASFFDYDKDGDLDVYLLNNSFVPVNSLAYSNKRELRSQDWKVKEFLKGGGDKLLRNDNHVFVDVSEEAGIYGSLIGFGLGITVGDINSDLWPDIYVSNDFYERDYLYINEKNGTFSEKLEEWASHISLSSMGADLADINNDGTPDVFVTDMLVEDNQRLKESSEFESYDLFQLKQGKDFHKQYMQNTLQLNNANHSFSEIAHYAGVAMTDWSWGALLFDMDNDGLKDIFVSNGIYHDLTNQDFMDFFADDILEKMMRTGKKIGMDTIVDKMPSTPITNYAFKNDGDLTFTNTSTSWGFETASFSNGMAYGDLDNDGDLDLVINNVNQAALIYKNETNAIKSNSNIQIKLVGNDNNRFGIGAIVNIYADEEIIYQELQPSRGFQSSVDYVMTVGLGELAMIDSLVIIWPDMSWQVLKEIQTNQLLILNQNQAQFTTAQEVESTRKAILNKQSNTIFKKQEENDYVDFNYEGLTYKMISKEGPIIISGDVDNNGLEDLFIGGPMGQEGQVYFQKSNGFHIQTSKALLQDYNYEDTAASFFDANGDGYLDLIVGAGGNQVDGLKSGYDLRLYINDGFGNFTKSLLQIPNNVYNTSVIVPCDFDLDNDIDLFVGSRSISGMYGISPAHYLLENDGKGNFINVIEDKAPDIQQLGMITDAQWKDFDSDGVSDLIVTEDWGGVHLFLNKTGLLKSTVTNLNTLNGWWKTVRAEDLDNDGDIDLVLGNRGTNSIYVPDSTESLHLYINDFDNNGSIEQVFTTVVNGQDVPIHLKRELMDQLPILKKDNQQYSEYSKKSIQDLFPENKLERAIKKSVNISKSVVALNNGDHTFKIINLPPQAQFSCINDLEIFDLNDDGNLDIIYGGNDYSLKPQFSQLDANYGGVLLGDGRGYFKWLNYTDSGFFVNGVINTIKIITAGQQGPSLIIGVNDEMPLLYSIQQDDLLFLDVNH